MRCDTVLTVLIDFHDHVNTTSDITLCSADNILPFSVTVWNIYDSTINKYSGWKLTSSVTENGSLTDIDSLWSMYPKLCGTIHTMSRYNGDN